MEKHWTYSLESAVRDGNQKAIASLMQNYSAGPQLSKEQLRVATGCVRLAVQNEDLSAVRTIMTKSDGVLATNVRNARIYSECIMKNDSLMLTLLVQLDCVQYNHVLANKLVFWYKEGSFDISLLLFKAPLKFVALLEAHDNASRPLKALAASFILSKRNAMDAPKEYTCPITLMPIIQPVVTADGHTYERTAIVQWLQTSKTSPMTGQLLEDLTLRDCHMLRAMLDEIRML